MMTLHPLTRIIVIFCITSCSLIYPQILFLSGLLVMSIFLMLSIRPDKAGYLKLFKQLRNLLPVIISIFLLQLLFDKQGNVIFNLAFIHITQHGLDTALQVTLRLLIIIISAVYLSKLTIRDYLNAFRKIHLPESIAVMCAITIGFIPMLSKQIKTSQQQIGMRGIEVRKLGIKKRMGLYQSLVMPILGRTLSLVKYQAIALDLRGFRNGAKHTHYQMQPLTALDWSVIILAVLLLGLPLG